MSLLRASLFTVSLFAMLQIAAPLQAQDWPAFRGGDGLGTAQPGGILSNSAPASQKVDLKIRWRRTLGSGYSSVVVVGDRVVTCYTDGESDKVICLNKQSGEPIWDSKLGAHFKGENGSFNGPIATPLIQDELVYALDPAGRFTCLNLADGAEVWSKDMVGDFGSVKPLYGFATSPIIVGDMLILQTGTKEKSLSGLDPKTGVIQWSVSDDSISSQTPVAMTFQGRSIVLAAGGKKLIGVNPTDGKLLFEFEHQGGNGGAIVPVPIGNDRVVMTLDDAFSKAVKLRPGNDDLIEVSEEWQNRSIKNTYNVPALSGESLFAYSTRILTCVDPDTGNARWKSRAPGDGFLITIDDHLIINTKQGGLHVAKVNAEKYDEVASLDLFDDVCWSLPAYSDNAIFCRNLKEIVRVDIVAAPSNNMGGSEGQKMGPAIAELAANWSQAEDNEKQATIDKFLKDQSSFPIVKDGIATFVYRGPGKDVAVAADIFGARQERKMKRFEDSDLFFYEVELQPTQRTNYMFLVDYKPQTDPLNDRQVTSSMYAGEMEFAMRLRDEPPLEMSWFGMSQWKQPEYLESIPADLRGSISTENFASEVIESGFDCEIYLPAGYAESEDPYRTIYVFASPGGRQLGQLVEAVDNIFATENPGVEPAILIFATFPPTPAANQAMIDELIPAIDKKYRTKANRESRTTVGFGFAGGGAISQATSNPDKFCGTAVYSPLIFDAESARVTGLIEQLDQPMEIYIEWGRFDMFNPHENWDIRASSKDVFDFCQQQQRVQVRGGMVNDSTDWSSWRNRYLEFLKVGQQK